MKALKGIAGLAIVVAIVLGVKTCNQNRADAAARTDMEDVVRQIPGYGADEAYFTSLLDEAHDKAFDYAYRMGGRRRGASFDEDTYLAILLTTMAEEAQADGRTEVFDAVEAFRKSRGIQRVLWKE